MPTKDRAIILLSGGLDSATVLHIARERGLELYAISFNYGQRHLVELEAARRLASAAGVVEHKIIRVDPALFQGTALVNREIEVPRDRDLSEDESGTEDEEIPVTYVPARNILFLSHALAMAESYEIGHIFLGINALDYSGYPDCRPDFLEAFERMAALGMKTGVQGNPLKMHAPLIEMTKTQIIQEGLRLGVDYGLTTSCYNPSEKGEPCGHCDSCQLRLKGFAGAGEKDPLVYPPDAGA